MHPEPVEVILQVTDVLESLGVSYAIGGSMASTAYGRVRTTMDVDLVADLWSEHVEPFVDALSESFYLDPLAMHAAIERRTNFNLIHLETMFKVDIFVAKERPFDQQQLARRVRRVMATDPERTAYLTSAEDTILAKLEWYRMGGEVSGQQWGDVQGILKVHGDRLDSDYLRQWAGILKVTDLLERALSEVGTGNAM